MKKPAMTVKTALLVAAAGIGWAANSAVMAADFSFHVAEPSFTVTLPGIPQMNMAPHPLNASKPHLRYLGSEGAYTVSILTPTADAGMTALQCASSMIRSLASRPGVPPAGQVHRGKVNDHTFAAIYASPGAGFVQLHAHVLSAVGGTHCVEVHASKIAHSKDEVDPWFTGFAKADISSP